MRHRVRSPKNKLHSVAGLPQETTKISNKQSNFIPKGTGKRKQTNPKVSRRKEIIKVRVVINKRESREIIQKINENKIWFFENINKISKSLTRLIKKKEREGPNKYNQK